MIEIVFWVITILLLITALIIQNGIINDLYRDIEMLEARAYTLQKINNIQRITLNAYQRAKKEEGNARTN